MGVTGGAVGVGEGVDDAPGSGDDDTPWPGSRQPRPERPVVACLEAWRAAGCLRVRVVRANSYAALPSSHSPGPAEAGLDGGASCPRRPNPPTAGLPRSPQGSSPSPT